MGLLLQRLVLAGYGSAAILAFVALLVRRKELFHFVPVGAMLGLLCQLMIFTGVIRGGPALAASGRVLEFLSLAGIGIYLYGYFRFRLHVLGVVMLPLALILYLVSGSLHGSALPVAAGLRHPLLWFHIGISALGVGALLLTCTFSVIYLVQERALKGKRPARYFLRLPSLSTCDRVLYLSLMVGFVLLTVGLVVAAVWSANFRGTFQVWHNQREYLALLAWAIFGVVLYARLVRGWRGRKTALLSIAGFAAVMLRLLGAPFLGSP